MEATDQRLPDQAMIELDGTDNKPSWAPTPPGVRWPSRTPRPNPGLPLYRAWAARPPASCRCR